MSALWLGAESGNRITGQKPDNGTGAIAGDMYLSRFLVPADRLIVGREWVRRITGGPYGAEKQVGWARPTIGGVLSGASGGAGHFANRSSHLTGR